MKRVYQENDFAPADPVVKDGTIGRHYNGKTDSSKMGRRRQSAYKRHLAVDGDSRVITSVEVSSIPDPSSRPSATDPSLDSIK